MADPIRPPWPFMSPLARRERAETWESDGDEPPPGDADEGETRCTSKDGKHSWRRDKDWMGDPSIPNGTCEWTVYRCIECGFEHPGTPEDYYEPEPPERDYGHDRDQGEHDDEVQF